uniref:Uncharacterized protein n=1 Tax=Timema monikensis TaxID=170555 RepID=A0A7R9HSL7_9NEOP|nr:unnamed protein product [Timema monikensis]
MTTVFLCNPAFVPPNCLTHMAALLTSLNSDLAPNVTQKQATTEKEKDLAVIKKPQRINVKTIFINVPSGPVVIGSGYGPRGSGFDSRRVQIIWEAVGLERARSSLEWNLREIRVENHLGKITLNRPDRDSNTDLPFIGSLVHCSSDALNHVAIKVGAIFIKSAEVGVSRAEELLKGGEPQVRVLRAIESSSINTPQDGCGHLGAANWVLGRLGTRSYDGSAQMVAVVYKSLYFSRGCLDEESLRNE